MSVAVDLPVDQYRTAQGAPLLVHYEHPDRPGQAWCGANVHGVKTTGPVECVVCVDLYHTLLDKALAVLP